MGRGGRHVTSRRRGNKKWRKRNPGVPLLRWADDLLVLAKDKEEAARGREALEQLLLPAGFTLKWRPGEVVRDLRDGGRAEWLGYGLSTEDGLGIKAGLTDKAWRSLQQSLELCHTKDDAPIRAVQCINGWVTAMGPCYPHTDVPATYARVVTLANSQTFTEVPVWRTSRDYFPMLRAEIFSARSIGK